MRNIFLLILAALLSACTNVFFQPQNNQYLTPNEIGLAYEDVYFTSTDGVRLHGWLLPAQGAVKGTVLFLHGNAENISTHIASVHWLPAQHYNVFLPDYRGYGLSGGSPSLAGAQDDINSAMAYLLQRKDVDPERIVILAQSLGGALAIYNIAHSPYKEKIKALISESAFSDYRGIVREKLDSFWLTWPLQWPLSLTINDDYNPLSSVSKVSPIPLLIIHGDNDNVVPLNHGAALYAAAAQPKEMWVVDGGAHIEAFRHKKYQAKLLDYLTRVLPDN
jgi:hypothetical protein